MKKTIAVVSVVLTLCLLAGGLLYINWKRSPVYSIKQAGEAWRSHDKALFEKYVDLDTLLDNVIGRYMEGAIKENAEETDPDMQIFAMGIAGFLKPMAVSMAKEMIVASIEPEPAAGAEVPQAEAGKDIRLKRIKTLSKEGDRASVELIVSDPETGEEIRLVLGLSKAEGFWKIDDVSNSTEILENWETELEDMLGNGQESPVPAAE